ncbi:unnamed protein product [Sphagnum compactum]
MFLVPQGKVDTSDKEMVPVCVFNFAPLNISFKDVQKCADFIKVEVGDITGTWIIGWMLTASFKLMEGDEGLHWAAGDGGWVTRTATVGGGGGGSALVAFSQ